MTIKSQHLKAPGTDMLFVTVYDNVGMSNLKSKLRANYRRGPKKRGQYSYSSGPE